MKFGEAFSFAFRDLDWTKKMLIMVVVPLIPLIGPWILLGWSLEITRRIIQKHPTPLPELDFSKNLMDGLKMVVVNLVYLLPIFLLVFVIAFSSVLLPLLDMGSKSDVPVFTLVMLVVVSCILILEILYGLFMGVYLPVAYGRLAETGELKSAFEVKEVWALLKAAPGDYLFCLFGSFISGIIAQAGMLLCGIGIFFTNPYIMTIMGNLYGQAHVQAVAKRSLATLPQAE
ncbi:MAG TPA: DUF4013 domain-containing protein [Anaerolineaceae bacterium]